MTSAVATPAVFPVGVMFHRRTLVPYNVKKVTKEVSGIVDMVDEEKGRGLLKTLITNSGRKQSFDYSEPELKYT